MVNLFPLHTVITAIAIIYAVFVVAIIAFFNLTGLDSVKFATSGSFVLSMLLLFFLIAGWRGLWRRFPKLNEWVYPDLNGKWKVMIHWTRKDENGDIITGTKEAVAFIKQNIVNISIELKSDESESETLTVVTKQDAESRRPMLFYIYKNEPKGGLEYSRQSHRGAALLKINPENFRRLEGNYFTDRYTSGRYVLDYLGEYSL